MRPHGFEGSPPAVFSSSSIHDAPPFVLLKSPLPLKAFGPSPPERNVQPLRRKSQSPAKIVCGFCLSIEIIEQPVEAFGPFKILVQVLPPSMVLYSPRSSLSLQSLPGAQT